MHVAGIVAVNWTIAGGSADLSSAVSSGMVGVRWVMLVMLVMVIESTV